MLDRIVKWIDKILITFLMILMVAMVVDVSWQVITRYVTPKPSAFTEELASFFMMWIGLLGAAYAFRQKAHLGIDILMLKASGSTRIVWEVFINTAVFIFAVFVLLWGGIRLVSIQLYLDQVSAAMQIKMGYIYLVLPLTGVLLALYSVYFVVTALQNHLVLQKSERTGADA